jgi:ADP-ribose pyrophosphatase YjhB (NUDIX family)
VGGHFCVNCGTSLEIRTIESQDLEACPNCDFVLWRDPKVATAVVVEAEGGIVLGRRAIEPGFGRWCLPGGFVNDHEHPAESAARECREEITAEVEIVALLGVYHIKKLDAPSMVGIAYRARLRDGEVAAPGAEMLEVGVFGREDIPELAFPSHTRLVRDWLAGTSRSRFGDDLDPVAPD